MEFYLARLNENFEVMEISSEFRHRNPTISILEKGNKHGDFIKNYSIFKMKRYNLDWFDKSQNGFLISLNLIRCLIKLKCKYIRINFKWSGENYCFQSEVSQYMHQMDVNKLQGVYRCTNILDSKEISYLDYNTDNLHPDTINTGMKKLISRSVENLKMQKKISDYEEI